MAFPKGALTVRGSRSAPPTVPPGYPTLTPRRARPTSQPLVFTKYILAGAMPIALQHGTRVLPRAHGQPAGNALDWRAQAGHSPRPAGNLPIMTQATELLDASRASHFRIVGVISTAHFVSHYYIIILAPLLPFVRVGIRRQLYRDRSGARRIQRRVGRAADAGRLSGRLARRTRVADRWIADRGERVRGRRPGRFVLGDGGDVRARRRRQHGLSPGRLRAAVASRAAQAHRPGVFDSHFCRHARSGGGAGQPVDDAERVGLARRLYRRRRFRLCRGGYPRPGPRQRRRFRRALRRPLPAPTSLRMAGGFCCRRRSCSICSSSS